MALWNPRNSVHKRLSESRGRINPQDIERKKDHTENCREVNPRNKALLLQLKRSRILTNKSIFGGVFSASRASERGSSGVNPSDKPERLGWIGFQQEEALRKGRARVPRGFGRESKDGEAMETRRGGEEERGRHWGGKQHWGTLTALRNNLKRGWWCDHGRRIASRSGSVDDLEVSEHRDGCERMVMWVREISRPVLVSANGMPLRVGFGACVCLEIRILMYLKTIIYFLNYLIGFKKFQISVHLRFMK